MNREAVFRNWVPANSLWSLWARPILFAQMDENDCRRLNRGPELESPEEALQEAIIPEGVRLPRMRPWTSIDVSWAKSLGNGVLLVVDLPGEESVWMGLALAGIGYRPVPLYNACCGVHEVINQGPIISAILAGNTYLADLSLSADASPVFLLDANRMRPARLLAPGAFDNRWQVFPQDFPSATFLAENGFIRVVLLTRNESNPAEDLSHVLRRWQDAGIGIELKDVANEGAPMPIRVGRPPWYRSVWQRLMAIVGLRPAWQGGFGCEIPKPSKSHG